MLGASTLSRKPEGGTEACALGAVFTSSLSPHPSFRIASLRRDLYLTPVHPVRRAIMLDILMLAIGLAFFALSIGYVRACERL